MRAAGAIAVKRRSLWIVTLDEAAPPVSMPAVGDRRALDHGNGLQPLQHLAHHAFGIGLRVAVRRRVDRHHQEIAAVKTEVAVQTRHRLHEQARSDQQDQRERELAGHQQLAQSNAAAGVAMRDRSLERRHERRAARSAAPARGRRRPR